MSESVQPIVSSRSFIVSDLTLSLIHFEFTFMYGGGVVVQLLSRVYLFATPRTAACHGSLSFTIFQSLFKLMSNKSVMTSIQPSHPLLPLLFLPSIFPSIMVFSNESALPTRWPKYCSFSFSISPSNEYSALISLGLTGLILQSEGLPRVFSRTTIQKHQFFGSQPSLWSNSHIRTRLLEKKHGFDSTNLLAKWCLCFLICFLGRS